MRRKWISRRLCSIENEAQRFEVMQCKARSDLEVGLACRREVTGAHDGKVLGVKEFGVTDAGATAARSGPAMDEGAVFNEVAQRIMLPAGRCSIALLSIDDE